MSTVHSLALISILWRESNMGRALGCRRPVLYSYRPMLALSQKRRSSLCISVNTRRVFEDSGIKQYIFPGSEVNVFHAFRFGVQKLLSNSGIRNGKVYLEHFDLVLWLFRTGLHPLALDWKICKEPLNAREREVDSCCEIIKAFFTSSSRMFWNIEVIT